MLLPQNGPTMPIQVTEERAVGVEGEAGSFQIGTASIQSTQIWDRGQKNSPGPLEHPLTVCFTVNPQ